MDEKVDEITKTQDETSSKLDEKIKGFQATYEKSEGEKVARDGKESSNFPINKLQTQSSDKNHVIPETEENLSLIR
ncbi:hypothetical protein RhiirA4_476863 [Rhizophagus irregularis]|uniref:Uncharacterized protein n=1 Tax=Rhizophagus irregularis TaxID=588596 RepID=A0A2I1HCE2_9GLOM|nr:hypothetical protein RhiirA4_476863 [Rhizophagus irregularis]